jgi:hypothetical protein
MIYAKRAHNR